VTVGVANDNPANSFTLAPRAPDETMPGKIELALNDTESTGGVADSPGATEPTAGR